MRLLDHKIYLLIIFNLAFGSEHVHTGFTFAQSFAIILLSCEMYLLHLYMDAINNSICCNRQQYTVINNVSSCFTRVSRGVTQGSTLGPFSFVPGENVKLFLLL